MLTNVDEIGKFGGLARARARDYETKTVTSGQLEKAQQQGWGVDRKNRKSVRLRRAKSHSVLLEDRVWSLLYKMQFRNLSGAGGAFLNIAESGDGPSNQIDVLAFDDDVAIAVECKSSEKVSRRSQFQEELAKLAQFRDPLLQRLRTQFPAPTKRPLVLAFFLANVILSDNDKARAETANVLLFDEQDLHYYEQLTAHLGPAAKYQFLADMLPGKTIPGLEINVPAVKTRMAGSSCYTFSITPEYLLKISYVSHRAKGKASDVNTYQRMLNKGRLSRIREYINKDGIFPTNIVVNLEEKRLQFQRAHQENGGGDQDSGILGWLKIRPTYKCAWIIDGQHRLFAYSGSERASDGKLCVLAFEGLPPSKQAELFIDINAKQKSVKQSLLQELYAELHWDSDDPSERVRAIISKAVQELDADPESPFHDRIQAADDSKDPIRCVTFTALFSALKTELFIAREKHGSVIQYGPFWAGDNQPTLERTVYILKRWFDVIKLSAQDWWDRGSSEGGGLAMNDGITACVNVLRSVLAHSEGRHKLAILDNEDLFAVMQEFAGALGRYLGSLSEEDRRRFRDLRGVQGQIKRTRMCQQAIREQFPDFNPTGLDEYLEAEKAQTNVKAKLVIDEIERALQTFIIEELKRECGPSDSEWWIVGVPKEVRKRVTARFEEEDGKRGSKEHYFDLIDYKHIAVQMWQLFEPVLAYGKTGNKDKKLAWIDFVNERRKIVAHASSGVTLPIADLEQLQAYEQWLKQQIAGGPPEPRVKAATEGES